MSAHVRRTTIDPRPTCVECGQRWSPDEGVDATCTPCRVCTMSFENMNDNEWARSLAKRIMGRTGERWFENGVAKAIEVAMQRARGQERESLKKRPPGRRA